MAIKKIPHASLQWDEIANDNFTNLDERVTKIGGVLRSFRSTTLLLS